MYTRYSRDWINILDMAKYIHPCCQGYVLLGSLSGLQIPICVVRVTNPHLIQQYINSGVELHIRSYNVNSHRKVQEVNSAPE